jgi:hypothetical protein
MTQVSSDSKMIQPKMRPRVFISYARAEGEVAAKDLRLRLEQEQIPLWQDRTGMEGGRDWWLQISAALDQVDFLVALMTPAAMISEIVRKEWRYARQQGVTVYPVKGASALDFTSLPRWMRDLHFYDLEHEWTKFVSDLGRIPPRRRVLFMADELPSDFVRRPEVKPLIDAFVDKERGEPVSALVALCGAGGFGKTTLASALCHEELIQETFDDGIAWVRLGENPGDLPSSIADLIETLTGTRLGFSTLEAAGARLAEVLADRDVLIVVDDVWNAAHLEPFLVGGPRCARLITTRNLDVLPSGAIIVTAGVMVQPEAVALVSSGLPVGSNSRYSDLAELLGCWPLLLRLANGALRERVNQHRQPLAAAVDFVFAALDRRGLTAFDARLPEARTQAIEKTLSASLDLLEQDERDRYRELAIFPTGLIPLSAIERIWNETDQLNPFDTEDLCLRLARMSLVVSFDMTRNEIILHDALRHYLLRQLGDETPNTHRALLRGYEKSTPNGWASGPNDGYFFQRLGYHLIGAEQTESLYTLLTHSPDWLQAQFAATRGDTSYQSDVLRVFSLLGETQSVAEIQRIFALYTALQLVRHRAAVYEDEELQVLVYLGRKPEALSYARLRSDLADRAQGLIAVATAHPESVNVDFALLDEAERIMRTIVDAKPRSKVLDALSTAFVCGRQLNDARRLAAEIDDAALRATAIARIGPATLSPDKEQILADAFEIAKTIADDSARTQTLDDLARTTLAAGALNLTHEVARDLPSEKRVPVLQQLVIRLANQERQKELADMMSEALTTIGTLPHATDQAAAYTDLGDALLEVNRKCEASRALAAAQIAAKEISTTDYYEMQGRVVAFVPMLVPQEGFFIDSALALNRIGHTFAKGGFTSDADSAFVEARQQLFQVTNEERRKTTLSKMGKPSDSETMSRLDTAKSPKSEGFLGLVRAGKVLDAAHELETRLRAREGSQAAFESALGVVTKLFANLDDTSTALVLSEAILDTAVRARALLCCVQAAAKFGNRPELERSFAAMVASARCERPYSQARLFAEFCVRLAEADLIFEAKRSLECLVTTEGDAGVDLALHKLAEELTATSHFDLAAEVVHLIGDPLLKERASRLVAAGRKDLLNPAFVINDLVKRGRVAEATLQARGIENDYQRSKALGDLGEALARNDYLEDAQKVAAEVPKDIGSSLSLYETEIEIAAGLARRGQFDGAIDAARNVTFDSYRAKAFARLAPILANADHHDEAEQLLHEALKLVPTVRLLDTKARIDLLGDLIDAASAAVLVEPTLSVAAELEKHKHPPNPDMWDTAGQSDHYERVEQEHQATTHRTRGLKTIGATLISLERLEDAGRIASALTEPYLQAEMRREGALRLVKEKRFAQALAALGRQNLDEWIEALASWTSEIEEFEPKLSRAVLANAVRIVGWLRSDWAAIAMTLNGDSSSSDLEWL